MGQLGELFEWALKELLSAAGITSVVLFLMVCYLAVQRELDRRQAAHEADERVEAQNKMADAMLGLSNMIARLEGIFLGINNARPRE